MTSIASSCSTLKYALCEFDAVIQRDETHDSKMQNSLSNLYVASLEKVYDKGNLIGRIRMYNDHVWKWITFNSDETSLLECVDAIIHHLFDQVITAAYQARQSHLAYQIQMIETHFKLVQNEEGAKALKARYLIHLARELHGANVFLADLAANFDANLFGKSLQCKDLDAIRNLVTSVSQATRSFWYKMLEYEFTYRVRLYEYLPKNFPLASSEKPISGAIDEKRLYNAIWKEQCWIDLEGHMEQTIPVIELIKICLIDYQLDVREEKRLDKWITGLNDYILESKEKCEKMQKARNFS